LGIKVTAVEVKDVLLTEMMRRNGRRKFCKWKSLPHLVRCEGNKFSPVEITV
jgi:hypothetical protein